MKIILPGAFMKFNVTMHFSGENVDCFQTGVGHDSNELSRSVTDERIFGQMTDPITAQTDIFQSDHIAQIFEERC